MKIFLDTGDVEAIERALETGLLDGVTTNPSLIVQTGRDFRQIVAEICQRVSGPVSVETMAETAGEMISEARTLAVLAPNIVVKIPMTAEGLKAVPELEQSHGIKTNVTMVFSATQAFLAMKAGASFISIVLSRLDAVGNESEALVRDSVLIKTNYGFLSEIIAGSLKTQNHILSCLRAGVDIATMPEGLFNQLFRHPLTDSGLEVFRRDWSRAKLSSVSTRRL
jgi:transaldolase